MSCCSSENLKAVDADHTALVMNEQAEHVFQTFARQVALQGQEAQDGTDGLEITIGVGGMHCASCLQLIEQAVYAFDHVVYARVNLSTERITVRWRGDAAFADVLAARIASLGYRTYPLTEAATLKNTHDDEQRFLLLCMAVSGFAMGNIMLLSVGLWSSTQGSMGFITRDFIHWISAAIALPVVVFSGRPFFRSAWSVLRLGKTNMDVPISLAIILASLMSIFEALNHGEHVYFDSAVMLMFFLLVGRYLDARARGKAWSSAQALLSMLSGTAQLVHSDGRVTTIGQRDVREGMVLRVGVGDKIAADGSVISGSSELDTSLITGESLPRAVGVGDSVFAGTLNVAQPIDIQVAKAQDDSLLSQIIRMMEQAEQGQGRYVRLADRAARLYTPVVHSLGALTFIGWFFVMGIEWQVALLHAVAVLIITCPCALGLAVPVVQVIASTLLMKLGVLLKSGDALERMAKVDTLVFDKTGTLTLGAPQLINAREVAQDELIIAAALASHSRHPLSQALVRGAQMFGADAEKCRKNIVLSSVEDVAGAGLLGVYDGLEVRLGKTEWVGGQDLIEDGSDPLQDQMMVWLRVGDGVPVRFCFEDALRPDAVHVIDVLQARGYRLVLLSGDRLSVATRVGSEVGIDDVRGDLSPVEKVSAIKALQDEGRTVMMVGDGLNDAPSLAQADVSMSPSSAIDISQNTADAVFQGQSLKPVLVSLDVAKRSTRLVKENFTLAVVYNLFAIPIAVLGYVTPMIAALAMSGSSLVVIGNSFRLKRRRSV